MERRTYWLTFCDNSRPKGSKFLGVCLIDVDATAAAAAKQILVTLFPQHAPGAEWIAAATRIAHAYGCNPGGEIGSMEIPTTFVGPRNKLMQRPELEQLDALQPAEADTEHDGQ